MPTLAAQISIDEVVEHALDAGFLENVLLPYVTDPKSFEVAEQLLKAQNIAQNADTDCVQTEKASISEFLDKTEQLLVEAADESKQAVALWREFVKLEDQMQQRFFDRNFTDDRLWINLGLQHFGFPPEIRRLIAASMERLIDTSAEAPLAMRRELLTNYYDVLTGAANLVEPSLALVATSLYFVDDRSADAEVVRLLERFPEVTSCWKKVMYATCLYRLNRQEAGDQELQSLIKDYDKEKEDRGRLAVALSVLYYIRYSSKRDWRQASGELKWIAEARSYAFSATNLVTEPNLLAYAYNLALYVLLEIPDVSSRDLGAWAEKLERLRDTSEWCYLYEDTLALFYLHLAKAAKNQEDARHLAFIARDNSQRAKDTGPYNKYVSQTWSSIHQFIAVNLS